MHGHRAHRRHPGAVRQLHLGITGIAPNRIFNIEYRTTYFSGALNYEVQLFEGQTAFDVVYGTMTTIVEHGNDSPLSAGVQKTNEAGLGSRKSVTATGAGGVPPVTAGQRSPPHR